MQDAIAKGISVKPTFVDPNKLENRELKTITQTPSNYVTRNNNDNQKLDLAKPLKGLKSGLA